MRRWRCVGGACEDDVESECRDKQKQEKSEERKTTMKKKGAHTVYKNE
jgi:hypothetical protein